MTISGSTADPAYVNPHGFHIPVMGTGFTLDTPLRVAHFGISSVISLVDDVLIEQVREYYCRKYGDPYTRIGADDPDARARRITAYMDLLGRKVAEQIHEVKTSPFEPGSPITRYFEMLPETPLKSEFRAMTATTCSVMKTAQQERLRHRVVAGSIDVNIMTKLDRAHYSTRGDVLPREHNDAMAALRGFALCSVEAGIVLSAGMHQHLYSYMGEFPDFFPDENGRLRKRIILKVSDYRSAVIQGKFLAKRGLWVSEFRVESGLNCGGHAFPTKGYLMGPILEEFKRNKQELVEMLCATCNAWRVREGLAPFAQHPPVRITVQGGVGTFDEQSFLLKYYNVDGTGWGTPFLLVPEATSVDDEHLARLVAATSKDVYLSGSSPLGVPFWNLRDSAAERAREQRLAYGRPGTSCPKGYIALNTDFSEVAICPASRTYQALKLASIDNSDLDERQKAEARATALAKSCICHDLGGSIKRKLGIEPEATPAICCGPNIQYFKAKYSLEEMIDHIYGRLDLLRGVERPHMFVQELSIYVEHLRDELEKVSLGLWQRRDQYYTEFKQNLLEGIEYYRRLAGRFVQDGEDRFLNDLQVLCEQLERLVPCPTAV